jgi:hypothetical protein
MSVQNEAGEFTAEDGFVSQENVYADLSAATVGFMDMGPGFEDGAGSDRFQELHLRPPEDHVGMIHGQHGGVVRCAEDEAAMYQSRGVNGHYLIGLEAYYGAACLQADGLTAEGMIDHLVGTNVHGLLAVVNYQVSL